MIKRFTLYLIPISILLGFIFWLFYQSDIKSHKRVIASEETAHVNMQSNIIASHFKNVVSDFAILSELHELRQLADNIEDYSPRELQDDFLSISLRKGIYDQIRLIEADGQEILRIDYNNGKPLLTPKNQLQNKVDRYYFKETMELARNEVYVSPLDLNIEKGKIEKPFKPMIRFGMPILNRKDEKRGALILNFLAKSIIDDFKNGTHHPRERQNFLLNSEGYWLAGPKDENEWGFMLRERKDKTFDVAHPGSWKRVLSEDAGQFQTDEGLFTFITVYPLLATRDVKDFSGKSHSVSLLNAKTYFWKIVSFLPQELLNSASYEKSGELRNRLIKFYAALLLLIGSGTFLFVKVGEEKRKAELMLHHKAKIIQLLQEVTVTANEATTIGEAIQICLDRVCNYMNWPVGHEYVVNSNEKLKSSKIWHIENQKRFEALRKATEDTSIDRGVGLPGRVLATGKPAWIADVTKDTNFPRAKLVMNIGVKAAFAFPVLEGEKVVAVLEFFSDEAIEPDQSILEALSNFAVQIGRVTERKRAEETMATKSNNLAEAQHLAKVGNWVLYPKSGKVEGSDELFRIFNIDSAEPTLDMFADVVHPEDREYDLETIRRGIEYGESWNIEHRLLLKDGTVKWIEAIGRPITDDTGKTVSILGTVQNITERKKAEEEIKRYRDHLEDEVNKRTRELNFQKFALDEHAIVSATDGDGNITYANDKFCNITGYTKDELMGKNHRIIKSGEHSPEFYSYMWNNISNGKVWHGEIKNKKKNGDYYWVKATIVPFTDKSGDPHQYIAIRTDITERKKAEKELNKYASQMEQLAEERSKQLIHADRMVTLGTLSAGVAHEINNPVGFVSNNLQIFENLWNQPIKAYLEKANSENQDKKLSFVLDEMPKMVKAMKEGTRRIINIVRGLGKYSRITKPVFEPLNICEIIEAAVKFCKLDLVVKHKIKIELDLSNDLPDIKMSRQEIEQVLINLITNSGHAMEEITDRKDLFIKIAASHVSNSIIIKIADNGHGMDKKTLDNIFNPFFTTKDVGKGTGLGLSICRGIIEQHRGTITATSTLGEGTTFIIVLPINPKNKERRQKDEIIIDDMLTEDRQSLN